MGEAKVKVTLNPTPSEQVVARANAEDAITDSRGRKIKLRNPGVLAQYRLVKMIGAEAARNEVYVNMLIPMLWVSEIDGEAVAAPASEREIEALIQRLGEEGIAAIVGKMEADSAANKGADAGELVKK